MFLDDTACNLASLNLLQFMDKETKQIETENYEHAVRLWTIVLEISVMMAQFPSKQIAKQSYEYRTLGLGYANIGGLLMTKGIPYDSDEGRALCGALTAIMTGVCYATSAEMAKELGPFAQYAPNRDSMLRVIRNHRRAARGEAGGYEGLAVNPVPLKHGRVPGSAPDRGAPSPPGTVLSSSARRTATATRRVSVIAPTGTIGLVMDCDTTGIEPDFALVKFKKLAGGGYFKIINGAVPEALRTLGYTEAQIAEIEAYAVGHGSIDQAPAINTATLKAKGFSDATIKTIKGSLKQAFDIKFVFNRWTIGDEQMAELEVPQEKYDDAEFDLLTHLGFSRKEIEAANIHVCGAMTLEGCPAPEAGAPARLRLRQPVRQGRQALPLGGKPHPHDGRGPSRSSPARSPRRSTCRTMRRWRTARRPTCSPGRLALKANAALSRRLQAVPAAQLLAHRR